MQSVTPYLDINIKIISILQTIINDDKLRQNIENTLLMKNVAKYLKKYWQWKENLIKYCQWEQILTKYWKNTFNGHRFKQNI